MYHSNKHATKTHLLDDFCCCCCCLDGSFFWRKLLIHQFIFKAGKHPFPIFKDSLKSVDSLGTWDSLPVLILVISATATSLPYTMTQISELGMWARLGGLFCPSLHPKNSSNIYGKEKRILKAHHSPKEERMREAYQGKGLETESNAEDSTHLITYIVCKWHKCP